MQKVEANHKNGFSDRETHYKSGSSLREAKHTNDSPYHEELAAGSPWRETLLSELDTFITSRRREVDACREAESSHDKEQLRRVIMEMLGWPLCSYTPGESAEAEETLMGEDSYSKLVRLRIETLPGLRTYAILAVPHTPGPHPLVLVQHGGGGIPEQVMGLNGHSDNYRDLAYRLRQRHFMVLAPQLSLSWGKDVGGPCDQYQIENSLRHLGGSLAALEATRLLRCLDYVSSRNDVDAARIGMAGLSYGGFYTLLIAALDERIRAAYSSCFFNNRYRYTWNDLVWKGSASRFLDPELAGLIAPRSLYIDLGRKDEVFTTPGTEGVQKHITQTYAHSEHPENLVFHVHEGGHEFDPGDGPINFIGDHLSHPYRNGVG